VKRIYLDNAATSWPKPDVVYAAVDRYLRENGAPAGRSAYREAAEVESVIASARASIARLIGADHTKQIVLTFNATGALNLAIHGLLRPGDHAIATDADHNSVLRPLRYLQEHGGVEVTRVTCDLSGRVDPDDVRRAIQPNTRLVAMLHASNVTGVIEPVAEVAAIAHERGARFLLDAAQSLGHWPVSVKDLSFDLLAAPGHKGLLGPLGTGFLYIRDGIEREIESVAQGGTGTQSNEDRQPESVPDKFEPGNHNVPGLVGLAAALGWLESRGIESICRHEKELGDQLRERLRRIPGVELHGPAAGEPAVAVVSISIEGYDPQEAAAVLDSAFRIQVRAGLHCAGRLHAALGTLQRGGTVRFSAGAFSTPSDIEAAAAAVEEIAGGK
jgi:cysteine desulfurase / selenocysteine lyase